MTASPSAVPSIPAPTPTATIKVTAAPATPAPATPSPASSDPVVFASTLYPYRLTLPASMVRQNWHAATRPWNGTGRIDMAGLSVDRTGIPEGGLYLVGAPAPDGLEAFFDAFATTGTQFHGCTQPAQRREVVINEVPAIGFTQRCGGGTVGFARVAMVKDGYGIGAFISTPIGAEADALDSLVSLLDGLEWTAG